MRTTISDEASGKMKGTAIAEDVEATETDDGTEIDRTDRTTTIEFDADDIEIDESTGEIKDVDGLDDTKLAGDLKTFGNSTVGKVTGIVTATANIACSVMNVFSAINLVVAAYQVTQIVKVASSIFEAIQKGQVEDSSTAPLHEIANSLTMQTTNTYQNVTDVEVVTGDNVNKTLDKTTRKRSAMEAEAVKSMYNNSATNYNDASIKSFNLSESLGIIGKVLNFTTQAYKGCLYAQLIAGVADAVKDTVDIVLCVLSIGIGCVVDALIDAGSSVASNLGIQVAVSAIVSILMPIVVKVLTRKIATDVVGEDLGNALVSGANIYMGQNHQYSGGAVANKDGFKRYIGLRDQVNADNARLARETLSPFDYTSQYTFAGTLITKMMLVTVTASSVMSSISSLGNVFASALHSITPGASAVTAAITAEEAANSTAKHCPDLDAIGAVGDAFCNPYIITDTRTLDDDPAVVVNSIDDQLEDTGGDVPAIKKDSSLAKYIVYCGQRQSPFGMADNNIASSFEGGSMVGDTLIGAVPVIGDLYGSLQNELVLLNYGYVSGEACVVDNEVGANATYSDWEDNQKYQRFIEDQRLIENEGLVEKSAVTAFLEDYYEEHPIDNSYEGILARRSGLTKDQVIATLDTMEFIAWQQGYDPSEYAPYVPEEEEETRIAIEATDDYSNIGITITPFYEERRQRHYTI